jgi:DNA-binding GntR family transcriptional regulator
MGSCQPSVGDPHHVLTQTDRGHPDLTEQVYERLLHAICNGELAPGTRLTQEELAAALAVSRQSVLQAPRLLKKDGFVIDAGRRGLQVAPLAAQAIAQVYEVDAALARAPLDPVVIDEGRRAVAGQRIGAMIDADRQFHHVISAASGNPLIAETVNHH